MHDTFDVHGYKCFNYLPEYVENLINSQMFLLGFIIVQKITPLAILHQYFNFLLVITDRVIIDMDQIGMPTFLHNLYLFQCLLCSKWVHLHLLQSILLAFIVIDQIHNTIAALPQYLLDLIFIH